jgi:hypothetical protein
LRGKLVEVEVDLEVWEVSVYEDLERHNWKSTAVLSDQKFLI